MQIESVALTGFNLVEASAGTGKTHTLTGLYLRLLLEQGCAPDAILVVTYTKAATAELKTRIRQRLLQARSLFEGGGSSDPLLVALYEQLHDKESVRKRLDLAIAGFDQAAIFTIHGFCQRVLTEHAFETGQTFQTDLVPDQAARLQQIADDFWRREMDGLPPLFAQAFREWITTPDVLLSRLRPALGKPYLHVRAAKWPESLSELEQQARQLQVEVRSLWEQGRAAIQSLLSDGQVLKGNVYRQGWVEGWCEKMDQWLLATPYQRPFDKVERFTPSSIGNAVKKGRTAPQHPFFQRLADYLELVNQSVDAYDKAVVALQKRCYEFLLRELPRRQAEAGEWSYDDLLLQLQQALQNDHRGQLAGMLRRRYSAALVDEFQDTDPVQYRILRRIYQDSDLPVFLVGDPKQAIYSFRGADIFAYLRAKDETGAKRHTLDANWRSAPGLVQAVNALFSQAEHPFYDRRIEFRPVEPATREIGSFVSKGEDESSLRIWKLPFDERHPLEEIRQAVAEAIAGEIARLLSQASKDEARIGDRPLRGSDIAVLVRKHEQAARIAHALQDRGIHVVRGSQQSVYWSDEAEQVERLLIALLEPHRGSLMRAALATPLLGWDAAAIDELNRREAMQSDLFNRFFVYHRAWQSAGFVTMFKRLTLELGIETRLLDYRDGERRLTNFYHLTELLHQQDTTARPGMEGLVKWFGRQRQSISQDEERLLRLESDGDLVKIDTLHHSKGLEYGIVFCPYLWDETSEKANDRPFLFHDPAQDHAAVLELGSDDFQANQRFYREEAMAENLRLSYVALTRARHRCYLPWGLVKQSAHSALGWLLHSGRGEDVPDGLETWKERAKALSPERLEQALQQLIKDAQGAISLTPMPEDGEIGQLPLTLPPDLLSPRRFSASFSIVRRVASFSSLVAGHQADRPDHDAPLTVLTQSSEVQDGLNVHGFPRGSRSGSCLHAILEALDFVDPERERLEALVREKLLLHAIDSRWTFVVVDWMKQILQTPLNAKGLSLSMIGPRQRRNEMAFYFPVHALDPKAIKGLAERYRFSDAAGLLDGLDSLHAEVVDGFIKGYIDLVFEADGRFYLADYKSNWLGDSCSDYHQQALLTAMISHHYALQYLLYSLALHRYLRLRQPEYEYERHFGGVYYLFLRGMRPQTGCRLGVVAERPSRDFIEALDRLVMEGADVSL
ncbi:MAG: exodeoxyribonuclease V subunit beta [Candidatus Thiodiazotropha sp. (ex Epidulcina cf. delphinae)]|nr:exodeoxyribonuclease V subunit beta [Candidatus Thiodiazotropha sp. (ex Epidulcina cf. delphinae)]